jgi:hypothetical protein
MLLTGLLIKTGAQMAGLGSARNYFFCFDSVRPERVCNPRRSGKHNIAADIHIPVYQYFDRHIARDIFCLPRKAKKTARA